MSQIPAVLYERRRRLAMERGEPFDNPPPGERRHETLTTIAETLRRRRQELQEQRQSLSV